MAFVSGSSLLVKSSRNDAVCKKQSRSSVVMMAENLWKTQWAGGFPGGEGYFKKWIEEGMTGYVPDLDDDKQLGSKPADGGMPVMPVVTPTASNQTASPAVATPPPAAAAPAASGDDELVMETDANGKMRFVIKKKE